jgi:saccharopine dehydrogenase-like NADP-dependent oxidoreductase
MKKAIVLGAGMVGRTIAKDLAKDFEVAVADVRDDALARVDRSLGIATFQRDLSKPDEVKKLVARHDVVVGALSSALGKQTLRAVLEAKKPYCDISFMADDPLELSTLAEENGVCAVVDCGVGPGMTNMFAGWAAARLSPCTEISLAVGGVPAVREWPFDYKVAFAPSDVLEEYTRPARFVRDGRLVTMPALTDLELVEIDGVGTLEAFNTDGLRTLLATLPDVPNMIEKTMRWPGHTELMRVFRETGFFDTTPIEIAGVKVRPIDVTSALLFPKWTYVEGEVDLTIVRARIEGLEDGEPTRYTWDLVDRTDEATGVSSMSRTTGFPAAIMARFLADRRFAKPGVHPPETVAREPGLLEAMLEEHEKRGVVYRFERQHGALQ